jgi:hypothetical protein
LYSAILAAAGTVKTRYVADRVNAVVLVTNGGDESADRLDAAIAWFTQQTEKRVLLFVVALPSVSAADVAHLRALVRAAGGVFYGADETGDIQEFIRRALLNL